MIASSVSITINGLIQANGGRGGITPGSAGGTPGSGGSIRLATPVLGGNGGLSAAAGDRHPAGPGTIRLEDFQRSHKIQSTVSCCGSGVITTASPFAVFPNPPLSPVPSVGVVSVAGVPVPLNPTGTTTMPDITLNQPTAVPVQIEAHNIPLGTIVKLHLSFEDKNGSGQIVNSTPLAGTLELSTATASVVLPPGFSQAFVRATWTP